MATSTISIRVPSKWAVCEKGSPCCMIVVDSKEEAEELIDGQTTQKTEVRLALFCEPREERSKRR